MSLLITLIAMHAGHYDKQGNERYSFFGSLDPAAADDFGNSMYLPEIV